MLLRLKLRDISAAVGSSEDHAVILRRFVKDASVPVAELTAGGVQVDLRYCAAESLVEQCVQFFLHLTITFTMLMR